MANLVMDFLHGIVSPFEYLGKTDIADPIKNIAGQVSGNQRAAQNAESAYQRPLTTQLRQFAGNAGQIGLDVVGGQLAEGAVGAAGLGDAGSDVASKIGTGVAKGVVGGAAVGGGQGVAQGIGSDQSLNAKNLTMDFLGGAKSGAEFGGVTGGAIPAIGAGISNFRATLGEAGGLNNPSDQLSQDDLDKIAKSDDPQKIEDIIKPVTGPALAKEIAPSVATDTDANTVKNQIDQATTQKLTQGQPPSPAPTPLPAPTPVSNVTTPAQETATAGQASASYTPEQQSLDATAPPIEKPFINAPGEGGNTPTHVGNLAATTTLHDDLNSGATVDEAMNRYMEATGANYGEAKDAVGEVMNMAGVNKGDINASLNPQSGTVSFPEAHDDERPVLNAQAAQKQVGRLANTAIGQMKQLSPQDLDLVRQLKGNDPQAVLAQAQDKAQFQKVIDSLKQYNDYNQAAGATLGQDLPYRQNYGLRTPYEQPPAPDTGTGTASLPTNASYTKGRVFNTHDEALANGAVPKYDNAIQDLTADAFQRSHDQAQLALAKGFEEAHPGQVQVGQIGSSPEGAYHQLLIPGGDKISLPAETADKINARQPFNETNPNWQNYDNLNAEVKNLKLGGGAFHGVTTAGTFVGQQISSGQFIKDPTALGDMVKQTFSSQASKQYFSDLSQSGHLRFFDQTGLTYSQPETAADVEVKGKLANIPVLKQIHEAIFGRELPFLKARSMEQWMTDNNVDPNNPTQEQLDEGTKYAKTLNNAYGGQNRAIQGLTPKQYTVASRALLSTDYTTGQLATLRDALTKGGTDGNLARQVVFGKALLFGGLATAGAAAGGEFKGQTPKQVAIDILHKTVNPSFDIGGYKVGLPATQVSLLEKPLEQTVSGAKSGHPLQGLQNFATSRLAAIPSEGLQLAGNKNFQGNPIYGKDFFGRPISAGDTASNIASSVLPIPASQAVQTSTGQESPLAALGNEAGLNVTPQYNLNYAPIAGQTYVERLQQAGKPPEQIDADTQFFNLLGTGGKNRSKVITQAETDIAAKNPQKAQQDIDAFNQKLVASIKPWAQDKENTQYFDSTMLQLLQASMIKFKTANSNVAYVTKTNPTSIGVPVGALASQPATVKR